MTGNPFIFLRDFHDFGTQQSSFLDEIICQNSFRLQISQFFSLMDFIIKTVDINLRTPIFNLSKFISISDFPNFSICKVWWTLV